MRMFGASSASFRIGAHPMPDSMRDVVDLEDE
jgi:hypothetical protein